MAKLRVSLVAHILRWIPISIHERLPRLVDRSGLARQTAAMVLRGLDDRDVRIPRGAAAGLAFNAAGSIPTYALGTAEPYVQEALSRVVRPGMTVYDIGCSVGFFTVISARAVGPGGRVVAFDALPANVAAARRNAERNALTNVEVHEVAVGAHNGPGRFAVAASSVWGRLVDGAAGTMDVQVVALDARIASGQLPVPDVIKIDIEGGEVDALAGLEQTLRDHRPLVLVEVHNTDRLVRAALGAYDLRRLDPDQPDANGHYLAVPR